MNSSKLICCKLFCFKVCPWFGLSKFKTRSLGVQAFVIIVFAHFEIHFFYTPSINAINVYHGHMKYTCQNMLKHPMRSIFLDLCGPEFGHTPTRCIEATQWMQATMPARYLHVSSNLPVYHVEWNKMNQ